MAFSVDIDPHSGFCGGVIRAISKAEEILNHNDGCRLYSLGSIVHNDCELSRLEAKGLTPIERESLKTLPKGSNVLIRAHGEPPATYTEAESLGLQITDCTCPVVLKLQESIREAAERMEREGGQIVIFGKVGHAEVLGLLGQTGRTIPVIDSVSSLRKSLEEGIIDINLPIEVFSQTTKSPSEFAAVCTELEEAMARAHELSVIQFKGTNLLRIHNTICSQVASRHAELSSFALSHDIVVFVSGRESSNGRVLCDLCKSLNIRTYQVSCEDDAKPEWFRTDDHVGICGATSTPQWQLDAVAKRIESFIL